MQIKASFYIFLFSIFFSFSSWGQTSQPEVMFLITNEGDSILTSKIFANKTNEDQVTILLDGKPKTYKANEIKSYFKKSRKYKIYIDAEKQYKLARIIVKGTNKLARSYSSKGDEKFYLYNKKKWINLDPHADDLITYLPKVLPNFNDAVDFAKIFYDSPSLGRAISLYNQSKDDDYNIMGYPGYTKEIKLGLLGSLGTSSLETMSFDRDFERTNGLNLGLDLKVIYNRVFSLKLQASYAQYSWRTPEASIKLNTLNFVGLGSFEFYRPSRKFGLYAAAGPNFILELNSEIDDLTTQSDDPTGLNSINLGYDFQLGASIGKGFDIFLSYQINPNLKSTKGGLLGNTVNEFKTNTLRGGLIYYFIN